MTLEELTALFRRLGAPDPEGWARSQIREGIDQLARFVFLREAWKRVVPVEDTSWIEAEISHAKKFPGGPGSGTGPALERLLATGGDRGDIHEVVRAAQWELLGSICYLLEDPGPLEPEIADLSWSLVRTNDDGDIISHIGMLHESVLETEPSGREMRPRST